METYHDNEGVATGKGFKEPGGLVGFVGCADNPTETPEPPIGGTEPPKPPPNDKEAQTISAPPLNRVLIDFLAFTYPDVDDPDTALEKSGIDHNIFSDTPTGGNGYRRSKRNQNMVAFYDGNKGMGCHISFSGQGCRQFETLMGGKPHCWEYLLRDVVNQGGKISRIDIAIDNVDGRLSMLRIRHGVNRKTFRSRLKRFKRIVEGSVSRNSSEQNSETIQFGSINSRILIKFYNKAAEQEKKYNLEPGSLGRWTRCELLIRDDLAQEAVSKILAGESLASLAVGVINNYLADVIVSSSNLSQCKLRRWWSAWLADSAKIKLTTEKAPKFILDVVQHIERQYSATFAMLRKYYGVVRFHELVRSLAYDGEMKMTRKHDDIINRSRHYAPADLPF